MKAIYNLLVLILILATTEAGQASDLVLAWGINNSGQTTVPPGLTNVVGIAAGSDYALALKSDGTVVAWGNHWDGYRYVPMTVPMGLTDVIGIAAGYDFNVALKNDGTVIAWGENILGQCAVPPGLSNVVDIATGYSHTLALKSDGTVVAWGWNQTGGTTVPGGLNDVVAIATGSFHSLALKSDGTVVTWGLECEYQKADPPPGLRDVIAIAAGCAHSLALRSDGTVIAWGENFVGQCDVPPGLTNVVAIAAGETHSMALRKNGTVIGWGQIDALPGLRNVAAIAGGWGFSLAIVGHGDPLILEQPQTPAVLGPQRVITSVVALGTPPLAYQWYAGSPGDISRPVPGALSPSLAFPVSVPNRSYWVRVSNALGSVDSQAVILPEIAIVADPQSVVISMPESVSLNVVAFGTTELFYQWFKGLSGDTRHPVRGANSSALVTPELHRTTSYWVRVTNASGSADSQTATVRLVRPKKLLSEGLETRSEEP